jgi:hypothetical protein
MRRIVNLGLVDNSGGCGDFADSVVVKPIVSLGLAGPDGGGSSGSACSSAAISSSYCSGVMRPLSFSSLSRSLARLENGVDTHVARFQFVQQFHHVRLACRLLVRLLCSCQPE